MTDLKQGTETAAVEVSRVPASRGLLGRPWMNQAGLVIVLLVVAGIASIGSGYFLTAPNIVNILLQVSVIAVIAAGLTLLLISGGVDFSMGSNAGAMTSLLAVLISGGMSWPIAVVLVLLAATLIGAVNGLAVTYGRVAPFVATLATATILDGLALLTINGVSVTIGSQLNWLGNGVIAGIPYLLILATLVCVLIAVIMRHTVFGRNAFAIGGNEDVARLSGVAVTRNKMALYSLNGLFSGIAAVMLLSRLGAASPGTGGLSLELTAVAAVVIGGTSLAGGYGTMIGSVLGVILLGVVANALNLLGVASYFQTMAVGLVLLVAALANRLRRSSN